MKANYIFAALAVVALASCSKSEIVEQNPTAKEQAIAFTNYTGAATRASVLDATGLASKGFGAYTFLNESTSDATIYLNNEKISTASWTYTNTQFWPKDEANNKLNFYFYAPYSEDANITAPSTATAKTIDFTVNGTVANQTDLLWAPAVKDAVYSTTNADNGHKVKAEFKHALSRIGFKAQSTTPGVTIVVKDVKITGTFNPGGTMKLDNASDATDVWSSKTTAAAKTYDPALTDETNGVTLPDATTSAAGALTQLNADTDYIMVIPTSTKYTIYVEYDAVMGTGDNAVTTNNKITLAESASAFEFAMGKAYTFNLKIGLNAIEFTATVGGWDETPASNDISVN